MENIPPPQPPQIQVLQPQKETNWGVVVFVLLLLSFLVAVLWSFFKNRQGEGLRSKIGGGNKGNQGQGESKTPQVSYSSVPQTPQTSNNSNAVAQMFVENAQIKEVQALLNKHYPNTVAQAVGAPLVVDGQLGEKTLKVIENLPGTKGKEIASAIRTAKYVTGDQMKWLLQPPTPSANKSTATVKADGTLNNSKVVDDVTEKELQSLGKQALEKYIMRKNGWTALVGALWAESDLRNWAIALHKNRAEFEVRAPSAWDKGIYSTRTGLLLRYF